VFFSVAVAIIPVASAAEQIGRPGSREQAALQGLVRMFAVLLVLETISLVGNYY
jgi:phospholipid/cholesterol/gamma-HCH transport system permease protein